MGASLLPREWGAPVQETPEAQDGVAGPGRKAQDNVPEASQEQSLASLQPPRLSCWAGDRAFLSLPQHLAQMPCGRIPRVVPRLTEWQNEAAPWERLRPSSMACFHGL